MDCVTIISDNAQRVIEEGYARFLNVPLETFYQEHIQVFETAVRDRPAWAKWVMPIWIARFSAAPVCSVSSNYIAIANRLIDNLNSYAILSPQLLTHACTLLDADGKWQQREILGYRKSQRPHHQHGLDVEQLTLKSIDARRLLNLFDGGVFVVRNEHGDIVAHAGIKNKGMLQEIAVWTHEAYRRQGMARAVASEAITSILSKQNIPTYVPDTLDNKASYLLAHTLGFEKLGEMIFWEYELPDWKGFLDNNTFAKIRKWVLAKNLGQFLNQLPPFRSNLRV